MIYMENNIGKFKEIMYDMVQYPNMIWFGIYVHKS